MAKSDSSGKEPRSIVYYTYVCIYTPLGCGTYSTNDEVEWPFPSGYTPPDEFTVRDGSNCDGTVFRRPQPT